MYIKPSEAGCDIITLNPQIIDKLKLKRYNLEKLLWKLSKCLKMLIYLNMKSKFSIFFSSWWG